VASQSRFVVLKFGGTSVADRDRWETVAGILRRTLQGGERPVVVHSALPGVTDQLTRLLEGTQADRVAGVTELATRHHQLSEDLGVAEGAGAEVERELGRLRSLLDDGPVAHLGQRAIGARELARQASIVAAGERLLSPIGVAFLRAQGLDLRYVPATALLETLPAPVGLSAELHEARSWLSAECGAAFDPACVEAIEAAGADVVLTQGFVARREGSGGEALLGRGGSDTAAAYLAGKLDAVRLEVWSDVPGMYSADPRVVPGARLIPELDYAEAQEIATTGSRVLHPRCIPALRERRIPIQLRSTREPDTPGTLITPELAEGRSGLRAISRKDHVLLLSIETVGMWQEVGFLARALAAIAEEGLSIDLVSTSETNVTVSLDGDANMLDPETLERLVRRLGDFAQVRAIPDCSAVSLVGRNVRRQLHRLGPVLEVFEEHRIHLVSQAASDLNFTVVVDESQAGRLVERLHAVLVDALAPPPSALDEQAVGLERERWWQARVPELIAVAEEGPAYVYDVGGVGERAQRLVGTPGVDRVLYAMKANWNTAILAACREAGTGFECVSPGELRHLEGVFPDLDPGEVVFTPNFAARQEYADALERGYRVTLDALHPIEAWPELFEGREVFLRVDPGWGRGHHEKVVTGGRLSKFGIPHFELDRAAAALARAGCRVVGLHTHSGSDILDDRHWARVGRALGELLLRFPDVRVLNLGGGLGVPSAPGASALSLDGLAEGLAEVRDMYPDREIWLEPGRWLVAESGVLLARVTQTKGKGDMRYIGLDVGMNALMRPALYGAHHEIVNLSRRGQPSAGLAQIVGPICESGDRLGVDRAFPDTAEGDVVLIDLAGAYGRVMASEYNLRPPPREVVLRG